MIKFTITLLILCSISTILFAQDKQATTDGGEKVILKPDFTWEYLKEDSINLVDSLNVSNTTNDNINDCSYKTNEIDEFTGVKKQILNPTHLIKYTPESLQKRYSKKSYDFMECTISASSIEGKNAIFYNCIFRSKDIYKTYGSIERDAKIIFKFKDGETLECTFSKYNSGETDYDKGVTIYSSYSILDDEQVKALKKNKINKVRIYWSKGYDNYDAYDPDAFINQLPCIE